MVGRSELRDDFKEQADWRRETAKQHPDDKRQINGCQFQPRQQTPILKSASRINLDFTHWCSRSEKAGRVGWMHQRQKRSTLRRRIGACGARTLGSSSLSFSLASVKWFSFSSSSERRRASIARFVGSVSVLSSSLNLSIFALIILRTASSPSCFTVGLERVAARCAHLGAESRG